MKRLIKRPITTLFMLMSADGKISLGANGQLDFDKDLPKTAIKAGLKQYYGIEQKTDLFSLNTGRVMAKIGINDKTDIPAKTPVNYIIIDNKPHLTSAGVNYLCKRSNNLYLITTNKEHPAFSFEVENLHCLLYENFDLVQILCDLSCKYKVDKLTIQSGGTLNCEFLRKGLIDYVHIIVAPILIGGKDTPTLIDGDSITNVSQLNELACLELIACNKLKNSYIELKYKTII